MFHLINMPMAMTDRPNLALSLFKAILNRNGLDAVVHDMNVLLAAQIGWENYRYAQKRIQLVQIMNALWAPHAWGRCFEAKTDEALALFETLLSQKGGPRSTLRWLENFRDSEIPRFLHKACEQLLEYGAPRVIGFSCNAAQTVPALSLGHFIKQQHPAVRLVYGGPAFHDEMGDELIRKVQWIDAVSLGQADDVVVDLFADLSWNRDPAGLQGILYRDAHGTVRRGSAAKQIDLDFFCSLPDPDFSDFFNTAQRYGLDKEGCNLPFEGGRGCWWGDKSKCMFCGLDACATNYRARPGRQVLATILAQSEKYGCTNLHAVDSCLSLDYFDDLIPALADLRKKKPLNLFCQVRADLSRKKVAALADAGFLNLQPGIESLCSRHLRLMRKGTRQIQNIYFLKLCRQYGITPCWQHMAGIPGERPDDYARLEMLIPLIVHLQPPMSGTTGEIQLHRFSPYFEKKKWTRHVRPMDFYAFEFPAALIDLTRVAYHFDAQWRDTLDPEDYQQINGCIRAWHQGWTNGGQVPELVIRSWQDNGCVEIDDTRVAGNPRKWILGPEQAAVLKTLDDPGSIDRVMGGLAKGALGTLSRTEVIGLLGQLMEKELVIREKKTYLSLVLAFQRPPALRLTGADTVCREGKISEKKEDVGKR
jgi:ribosomal peptide maturation radical SAM protein 1